MSEKSASVKILEVLSYIKRNGNTRAYNMLFQAPFILWNELEPLRDDNDLETGFYAKTPEQQLTIIIETIAKAAITEEAFKAAGRRGQAERAAVRAIENFLIRQRTEGVPEKFSHIRVKDGHAWLASRVMVVRFPNVESLPSKLDPSYIKLPSEEDKDTLTASPLPDFNLVFTAHKPYEYKVTLSLPKLAAWEKTHTAERREYKKTYKCDASLCVCFPDGRKALFDPKYLKEYAAIAHEKDTITFFLIEGDPKLYIDDTDKGLACVIAGRRNYDNPLHDETAALLTVTPIG